MIEIYLFSAAFFAFALSLVCGGGAGLLLIPILGYGLPAAQVPVALSIGTSVSSVTKLVLFFQAIQWRISRYFLPSAVLGVVLGAWLLSFLAPMYVELCMAIFLIANLPYLFSKSEDITDQSQSFAYLIMVGLVAGVISGLTGAVGVLFNRIYVKYGLSKQQVVATRAANEILLHLIKLGLYAYWGLFTYKGFIYGMIVAIAAICATFLMKKVLHHISVTLFSKLGYAAMVISGVVLLNSALVNIQKTNHPDLYIAYIAKGYNAELTWNDLLYTLEFKYDEGFEFERTVPLSGLEQGLKQTVEKYKGSATKLVVEKVYAIQGISYEVYYYDLRDHLLEKREFSRPAGQIQFELSKTYTGNAKEQD